MKIWLIRLLLRALYGPVEVKVNQKRMDEWLMALTSTDSGYKDYYTLRKRTIQDSMVLGIEQRDYWMLCGRLMELKQMNVVAEELVKKLHDKKKE